MLKPRRMLRHLPGAMLALLLPIHVFAELKGTNATFYSWDNNPSSRAFKNSNSSIILDGKWHPFFATLNFDSVAVNPAAASQSNGAVRCSTTDTDGNGLVGNSTPWAGTLQLSVDHIDTGSAPTINGFQSTRCWELAVCDRETNGTGQFSNADLATRPRYRRFAIDVTGLGSCPTPTQNASFGYVNPLTTNGFITLLSRDVVNPCSQAGRCNSKIDTNLYIILDRDCDGFIDDNDGAQVNNDPARGNLGLIGTGGAGRIPLPVGNNDPQVCFYAEGKKPDFTRAPQWTGNVQARITAPAGSSGDKTVNHSIIASPAAGDVGDLPAAFPAAVHVTNAFADPNPFLGASTDNDPAQYSSLLADGDDTTGNASSDEDGVVLPTDSTADGDGSAIVYTATATATNNSGVPAQLCGWFDMNQDQVLNNSANTSTTASDPTFASRTDDGERSCIQIPTGTTNGSFPVAWTIPASARENTGNFFLRFRISRDRDMFDSFVISASDGLNSGEVEDYLLEGVSTLPVSISSFLARATKDGLEVEWTTASETHNLGFDVWAVTNAGLEKLNVELVPASDDGDVLTPRDYRVVFENIDAGRIRELAITATDFNGRQDMYGLFEVESRYGEHTRADSIPWARVRQEANRRQDLVTSARQRGRAPADAGNSKAESLIVRGTSVESRFGDVRVRAAGMQRITHARLAAAGMDLAGTPADQIAVTFKGNPVAREIVDQRGRRLRGNAPFGPGDEIRFWGELPRQPDALYLEAYQYRIEADRSLAVQAQRLNGRPGAASDVYEHVLRQDDDVRYHLASPLADPWYAALLRADRDNSYVTEFQIDDDLVAAQTGRIRVEVGGLTRYTVTPDHHAEVEINGEVVGQLYFDGQQAATIDAPIRAGLLTAGANTVTIRATGRTDAPFDLFVVDALELTYPRHTRARGDFILIERGVESSAGLQVSGFDGGEVTAYAWDGSTLTSLKTSTRSGAVTVATTAADADYWLSTNAAMHTPEIAGTGQREDLFADRGPADLIVIAHPAFLPIDPSERHPLNEYIAQRESEGWRVGLFDVSRIQTQYAGGMPLPDAITEFLRDADSRFEYQHVLLVGGDSYDYTDHLGLGSISYIPTRYTATHSIPHTPSDALLVDFDGDRLADKAVGRWPVRTQGDLAAIVAKTLDWPNVAAGKGIVWVTDSEDSRSGSFTAQADRMIDIATAAGWGDRASRLYWGEVAGAPGQSAPTAARGALFETLESGQALTGFVGHGSPFMWTFQGLLRPNDLGSLFNNGKPTMINTLTCYTSYFVSPTGDSVAHRWMNGYRLDAAGQPIPGVANGAVALHGAGTLSNYGDNEIFAAVVLREQLAGQTVGQAIQAARIEARRQTMADLMVNWTLLGDPTLRLDP